MKSPTAPTSTGNVVRHHFGAVRNYAFAPNRMTISAARSA